MLNKTNAPPPLYDLVIIGGGINGCGCAADAALRGLSVLLCESGDIASKTSSSSSKLIHGGLRYLESFDINLVKKALNEQQTLLELAPHLVRPLPMVLPHQKSQRPLWLLRAGLFLYDHLSQTNTLPNTQRLHRTPKDAYFSPLTHDINEGFLFYDCATDDARLTLENAIQAREQGATLLPQTQFISAQAENNEWRLTLKTLNHNFQVRAKCIVNAAGPWVDEVSQRLNIPLQHTITHVKGSHMVVHKLYEGEHAYLLQHHDQRVIFVTPYHGYTMIGTTDIPINGSLDDVHIDETEIDYFLTLIHQCFNQHVEKSEIINTWSGVRTLIASDSQTPSAISRDYAHHFTNTPAPAVTLIGGKLTTYRQLAKEAIDALRDVFPTLPESITHRTALPGASHASMSFDEYKTYAREKYHGLDARLLERYLTTYGTRTEILLQKVNQMSDLGIAFSEALYQREVDYLIREEWVTTLDDLLWRRTKLGLTMGGEQIRSLKDYFDFCFDCIDK